MSRPSAGTASSKADQLKAMELADQTVVGLKQLLSIEAAHGAQGTSASKKKPNEARKANLQCLLSFDWALQKMNGWGVLAFRPGRAVGFQRAPFDTSFSSSTP